MPAKQPTTMGQKQQPQPMAEPNKPFITIAPTYTVPAPENPEQKPQTYTTLT